MPQGRSHRAIEIEQRVGAWASIVALVLFLVGQVTSSTTAREIIYLVGFVLLLGGFSLTVYVANVRLSRRARYAEVMDYLRGSVRKIVVDGQDEVSIANRLRILCQVMDDLATSFSILTGTACRCCIKVFKSRLQGQSIEGIQVKTLCRDSRSRAQNNQEPAEGHPIFFNTAFKDLYTNRNLEWFFGNDLVGMEARGEYKNTTPDWRSRYRAALVWPIDLSLAESTDDPNPTIVGYLCIDSRRKGLFSDEDYAAGALIADLLYPMLEEVVRLKNAEVAPLPRPGDTSGQKAG